MSKEAKQTIKDLVGSGRAIKLKWLCRFFKSREYKA
jgi:hypothetical protein